MFITFHCYQSSKYNNNIFQIKEIKKRLKENGFTLLGSPERYKMDDSLIDIFSN